MANRTVTIIIPGDPVPIPRARVVRFRGKVHAFTPEKAQAWKRGAALMMRPHFTRPLEGPVTVSVTFRMPTTKEHGAGPHVQRPDIDNLLKGVLDAGNGIAWHDDGQVDCVFVQKVRHPEPGVLVRITGEKPPEKIGVNSRLSGRAL